MKRQAVIVFFLSITSLFADKVKKLDSDLAQIERLVQTIERVHTEHPDVEQLNYDRLVNYALEGVLSSLDRFSYFYHPETNRALQENPKLDLEIRSLGLTIGKRDTGVYILAVTDHSAAAEADISAGDSLKSIDKSLTDTLPLVDILSLLRGAPGQTVKLSMVKRSTREPYDITLSHRVTRTEPITESHLIDGTQVGFIRLTEFATNAHTQLAAALDDLEDRGMKQLILDMRANPGGQLDVAVAILGEFLPPATEVVTTRSRVASDLEESFKTPTKKRRPRDYPIVALINRNSASAAELVPGSLQDLKRATIIGETSYGKGSVQNIQQLPGGSALRLTIATYHTPSGRTPHHVGIAPDISVEISEEDRKSFAIYSRRSSASPEDRETIKTWKDPFVAAALKHFKSLNE